MITAITGGIGSGKSYVCRLLERRGIAVYDCDEAAKRLILSDKALQERLSEAAGADLFPAGRLDKARLSRFILAAERNALAVDNIVHPAVAEDFAASGYTWLESAILFESGFNRRVKIDRVVCVTASMPTRIRRIMARDGLTKEKAAGWIERQMAQEEKLRLSDYEIKNDEGDNPEAQLDRFLAAP
ncbi:MAG: dephospho-CoA kinase, partial [Prevotella sp.]|nr:dephospho-CoA kinase [Prevotella sp.]